jgi:hypothetical protein
MNRVASLLVYGSNLPPQAPRAGTPFGAIRIFVEESGGRIFLRQEGQAAVDARECIYILGADAIDADHREDEYCGVRIEVETP